MSLVALAMLRKHRCSVIQFRVRNCRLCQSRHFVFVVTADMLAKFVTTSLCPSRATA